MKKIALILSILIVICVCACKKDTGSSRIEVVEMVNHGDYYCTNSTDTVIVLSAVDLNGDQVAFIQDAIEPGATIHIYTFTEGSGGHVMPSNAFSTFKVYAEKVETGMLLYARVNNADWIKGDKTDEGHSVYTLTVD